MLIWSFSLQHEHRQDIHPFFTTWTTPVFNVIAQLNKMLFNCYPRHLMILVTFKRTTRSFDLFFIVKVATGSACLSFRKTWLRFFVPRVPWEPFAPPHLFNAIYLNVQFSEKKGGKNNSQQQSKETFLVPRSGRGVSAVKLSASPLDQWLKTPRYVHVSCTCNHNLPHGFKVNTKRRETWQRAVPAPNGETTEDFVVITWILRYSQGHPADDGRLVRPEKLPDVRRNTN